VAAALESAERRRSGALVPLPAAGRAGAVVGISLGGALALPVRARVRAE
jgi:hypothetical protein